MQFSVHSAWGVSVSSGMACGASWTEIKILANLDLQTCTYQRVGCKLGLAYWLKSHVSGHTVWYYSTVLLGSGTSLATPEYDVYVINKLPVVMLLVDPQFEKPLLISHRYAHGCCAKCH